MTINENVLQKIKKLFKLAADNPNENEANSAMEKAHALMREYGIASAHLHEKETELNVEGWTSEYLSQVDSYARVLARAVATLFNCEQWMFRPGKSMAYKVQMCFAGEATDVALTAEVWPQMVKMAKNIASRHYGKGWTPKHRTFAEAFAIRINERCNAISEQASKPAEQGVVKTAQEAVDDQKWALVVAKKEEAIQVWLDEQDIKIKVRRRAFTGQFDAEAALRCKIEANKVNLNFRGQIPGAPRGDDVKMLS